MRSVGEKEGLEVWLRRTDGDKAKNKEYGVKHYTNKEGVTVSECWLECEDNALFTLGLETRGSASAVGWSMEAEVDSRFLINGVIRAGEASGQWGESRYRVLGKPDMEREGQYKFHLPSVTSDKRAVTVQHSVLRNLGTIELTMRRGEVTTDYTTQAKPQCDLAPLGIIYEDDVKLDTATEPRTKRFLHTFIPSDPDVWHIFIFKYRLRPALESLGIIETKPKALPGDPAESMSKASDESQSIVKETRKRKLAESRCKREHGGADAVEGSSSVKQAREDVQYFEAQLRRARTRVRSLAGAGQAEVIDISSVDSE